MSIYDYAPNSGTAHVIMAKAAEHNLSHRLVPALSNSGDIVLGVISESKIDAFNLGVIFGEECGPFSVEAWGVTQIFTYSAARIVKIGVALAGSRRM